MLILTDKILATDHADDTLTLSYEQRQKSRQRVRLDSGREAGVMLAPGTTLLAGECLRGADGTTVQVRAAEEAVSTARTDDPLSLARACYHLGNRHVKLQVGPGWARYQPDHVLDEMVRGLGLRVAHEAACFEPERGAYGSRPHGDHRHDDAGHGHHHHHHDAAAGHRH